MAFELFPNAFEVFLTILHVNKICIHGAKGAQNVFFKYMFCIRTLTIVFLGNIQVKC